MNTDIKYTSQLTTERDGNTLRLVVQLQSTNPKPPTYAAGHATDPFLYRHLAINLLDGSTEHDYIGPFAA